MEFSISFIENIIDFRGRVHGAIELFSDSDLSQFV